MMKRRRPQGMTKGILKQPETLPTFWKEEFERSLWPFAKRKRKQRCGCKKIHLLGLVNWSNGIGNKDHGGHLTTTNARRVTCFICLERMFWDRYLKFPDEFPKDFVLSRERISERIEKSMSLLVFHHSRRDPSGFGDSASLVFPGGSKEARK